MKKVIFIYLAFLLLWRCTEQEQKPINPEYQSVIAKAESFLNQNNTDSALFYFRKAAGIDTAGIEAHYGMGVIYGNLCADKDSMCAEAEKELSFVIHRDSTYRKVYYNRSVVRIETKDYLGALDDLNAAITLDSADASYFQNRATIRLLLEDTAGYYADREMMQKLYEKKQQ